MPENSFGLEKLSDQEIDLFLFLTGQIQGFPNSRRIFNELHRLSLDTISKKGKEFKFFPRRAGYADFNSERKFGIELSYEQKFFGDVMHMEIDREYQVISLDMLRKRGYRAQSFPQTSLSFRDLVSPKPYMLGMASNNLNLSILYN